MTLDPEPIELTNGQTLLIIVKEGRVIEYTWDMGLPHVEFVKRRVGELPEGAWVGTVSKIENNVVAISSKHFFGYQMPPPNGSRTRCSLYSSNGKPQYPNFARN